MQVNFKFSFSIFLLSFSLFTCQSDPSGGSDKGTETSNNQPVNPPAPGFNAEASDQKAINIADQVMEAMGGRKNWDQTRFITWNFFGARSLLWDKATGNVRIESHRDSTVYLINIMDDTGKILKDRHTVEHPDSLSKYVGRGKSIWINDSYWLVMPFKLKDSGVTLKYAGQDTTLNGKMADVLELTFENVGDTPQNKYLVYVDPDSHLVVQWDFFRNATDEKPGFSTLWADYKPYGEILLSGDRGQRQITDISVPEEVPDGIFNNFDDSSISALN